MQGINPTIVFPIAAVAFFTWLLVSGVRAGEFRYSSTGRLQNGRSRVTRRESPAVFWTYAGLHSAIILYIVWIAFSM